MDTKAVDEKLGERDRYGGGGGGSYGNEVGGYSVLDDAKT